MKVSALLLTSGGDDQSLLVDLQRWPAKAFRHAKFTDVDVFTPLMQIC
jgi:hypothetical protein